MGRGGGGRGVEPGALITEFFVVLLIFRDWFRVISCLQDQNWLQSGGNLSHNKIYLGQEAFHIIVTALASLSLPSFTLQRVQRL